MINRRKFLKLGALGAIGALAGKVGASTELDPDTEEEPVWRYSSMGIVAELEEEKGWVCNSVWRSSRGPPDWSTTSSLERDPITEEQAEQLILAESDEPIEITYADLEGYVFDDGPALEWDMRTTKTQAPITVERAAEGWADDSERFLEAPAQPSAGIIADPRWDPDKQKLVGTLKLGDESMAAKLKAALDQGLQPTADLHIEVVPKTKALHASWARVEFEGGTAFEWGQK